MNVWYVLFVVVDDGVLGLLFRVGGGGDCVEYGKEGCGGECFEEGGFFYGGCFW